MRHGIIHTFIYPVIFHSSRILGFSLSRHPSTLIPAKLISVIFPLKMCFFFYNLSKIFCLLLILATFECTELCFRVHIIQKRISDNIESLFAVEQIVVIVIFYFVFINNLISAATA